MQHPSVKSPNEQITADATTKKRIASVGNGTRWPAVGVADSEEEELEVVKLVVELVVAIAALLKQENANGGRVPSLRAARQAIWLGTTPTSRQRICQCSIET